MNNKIPHAKKARRDISKLGTEKKITYPTLEWLPRTANWTKGIKAASSDSAASFQDARRLFNYSLDFIQTNRLANFLGKDFMMFRWIV